MSDDEYVDDDLFGFEDEDDMDHGHPQHPIAGGSGAGRGFGLGNVGGGGVGRGRGGRGGFNALGSGGDPMGGGVGRGAFGQMFANALGNAGIGGPAGMFAGGHPMMRPAASSFKKNYRAYSTAILEIKQGRGDHGGGRSNLHNGGKSAWDRTKIMPFSPS